MNILCYYWVMLHLYIRIVVDLDEDDIHLILKHYKSFSITYELSPGIYTIKDFSETEYKKGDHEKTLQIEYDDINMKTKPNLTRFGSTFGTIGFDEESFFNTFWASRYIGITNLPVQSKLIAQVYILVNSFFEICVQLIKFIRNGLLLKAVY